jgi:hypothetical protein
MGLLAENLARMDELGMPTCLESSNRANYHRYERLGFTEAPPAAQLSAACGASERTPLVRALCASTSRAGEELKPRWRRKRFEFPCRLCRRSGLRKRRNSCWRRGARAPAAPTPAER